MARLLLHVCCGPCSTEVIARLRSEHDLTVYFLNPNIWPEEEYIRRRDEALAFCTRQSIPVILSDHAHPAWLAAVKGLEDEKEGGKRCILCFNHRLLAVARKARETDFELFATTLTISPHKNAGQVNEAGNAAARENGVRFLEADFKKQDGFLKSCRTAREEGMYRQDYCGCEFSGRKKD